MANFERRTRLQQPTCGRQALLIVLFWGHILCLPMILLERQNRGLLGRSHGIQVPRELGGRLHMLCWRLNTHMASGQTEV